MNREEPLRLWPGVVLVLVQWALWFGAGRVAPGTTAAGFAAVIGGWVGALGVLVWWVFFSRAPRIDRWGALALIALGTLSAPALLHPSIAEGNVGLQYYIYMPALLCLLLVAAVAATRTLGTTPRRVALVVAILVGTGGLALMRSGGLNSDGSAMLAFRWAPTAEDRLLAGAEPLEGPAAVPPAGAAAANPEGLADNSRSVAWPGFRGPDRRATVPGVQIETDWEAHPPRELWRRPVGPGTSSFAVAGEMLFTQEQRGDDEVVAAYSIETGEPVWQHRDRARMEDAYVGAGPRATPAVAHGRIYTLGATGILNALDARDGSLIWSRDAGADAGAEVPGWGFVSSPLIVGDLVVVYLDELAAYDAATGERRWHGPDTGGGYGSPELLALGGREQIVLATNRGAIGAEPGDGALLWEHEWPGIGIVQPAPLAGGDVLIGMIDSMAVPIGSRRISVRAGAQGWSTEERWTSIRLKTSFSSPVVHEGHVYGFDGSIMACIDVEAGERMWKGGRYGHGQLVLFPDQDLLLVLTEQGELALVSATPDAFREIARFPAIEGKTWSHPALAGDVLLVRNGQEMAAFRLALR